MGEQAKHTDPDAGLPGPLRLLRAADRRVQQVEVAACLLAFLLMIGLAFAQVFLRTFRNPGLGLEPIGWFDIVARHLVIWVGMLGASLATAEGRHISVEVLPKLLSDAGRKRLDVFLSLVSAAIVGVMLALSLVYMARVQLPSESELFVVERLGHLKVFRWPFLVIVPLGLAIIVWRLLLRAAESVVMTTAQFHEREAALEREVQERERAQEADGAALLVEADRVAAAESGRPAALTPEAAKDELRRLASGRAEPAPTDPAPPPAAGVPGTETERLPKAGPLTPRPDPPADGPRAVPGRSTDEIPVYRDLGDDEDLLEPDARTTDSSDGLEPRADAAEDAVEAVADTARLHGTQAEDEAAEVDDEPKTGETARMVAPSAIGPAEDIDHVPERSGTTVRMPGSGRDARPATDEPPPGGTGAPP